MESSMSRQITLEKVERVKRVCRILKRCTVLVKLMIMDSSCTLQKITKTWKVLDTKCSYGTCLTCYSHVHDFKWFSNLLKVCSVIGKIVSREHIFNHI